MSWSEIFEARCSEEALPELRRRVQERLRQGGAGEGLVARAGLLLSELAHNAVAASRRPEPLRVTVGMDEGGVHLSVECAANEDLEALQLALDASGVLPSPESERGRGLWLVLEGSRDLQVERTASGGVRVRLRVKEEA